MLRAVVLRYAMMAGLFALAVASTAAADDVYLAQVKPLLSARCYACHGALKQEAGLRLDTGEAIRRGGDSGSAVDLKSDGDSLILARVTATDIAERMPPEGEGEALKPAEIESLRRWIEAGAGSPADEQPERDPREHWAFQPIARPAIPAVKNGAWPSGAVDAFIAARQDAAGVAPLPRAEKSLLLRRVYLDLVGLPPTREELQAFLADDSPDAYERVVDRLLASPQYGERWGRHFMDIWRYSDWWGLGEEVRSSQKHMWHWRDWIVESLNADKPYDAMIRESLAADELYPNDLDRLRGTGLLARHYFKFNRTTWLDETIEHTGKAFLGLTFNCCKCHDHKYDPITQQEYYQYRAIFEPYQLRVEMLPGENNLDANGLPRAFDCNLDAPTYLHRRGDDRQPITEEPLSPAIPAALAFEPLRIQPVELPIEAYLPGLRSHALDNALAAAEKSRAAAAAALDASKRKASEAESAGKSGAELELLRAEVRLKEAELAAAELEDEVARARGAADRAKALPSDGVDAGKLAQEAVREERRLAAALASKNVVVAEIELLKAADDKKAEAEKKLAAAKENAANALQRVEEPGEAFTSLVGAKKTLESNVESEESQRRPFPKTSTGRRKALAEWITSPSNPLAARVAANHVWARHFGSPLVPTVFDFGRKGQPPTHPELLDWLAAELRDSDWSLKDLHRQIVTSSTYQLSGATGGDAEIERIAADNQAVDGDNRLYWKRRPVRMESQVVRDSLLALAGDLDLRLGGPSIGVKEENSRRRSLYFVHSHNEHNKFLAMFDDANVLECYRRAESIVPQQALALSNSKTSLAAAAAIAARIERSQVSDAEFVGKAWRLILCDEPGDDELAACLEGLESLRASGSGGEAEKQRQARVSLVHALLNHNDFLTIR